MQIPDELEMLSFFESEPELLDTQIKDLPFVYNQATYRFTNGSESFTVIISPSYNHIELTVRAISTDEIISYFDLQRVDKMEITADSKKHSGILLTMHQNDVLQTLQLEFKPRYKSIFEEHLNR